MENTINRNKQSGIEAVLNWSRDNTSVLLLIFMILLGTVLTDGFLTIDNFINLFRRVSVNGILAVGFSLVLLVDGFDLSLGGTLSVCAVLLLGLQHSIGMPLAMAAAILTGAAFGALNGLLMKITRGGSGEAFLITLGTQLIGFSVALTYTKGYDLVGLNDDWYAQIGQGTFLGIPVAALIWFAIMIMVQILIKKTAWGRSLLMTGGNKKAAYLSGIDVNKIKFIAFTLAGISAALGAVILTSRTTAASPRSGVDADFDAAIAAIIGGNSVEGGKGGMVQVFIGVTIYGLITNILNLLGVDSVVQYIVKGCILVLAIALDKLKRR